MRTKCCTRCHRVLALRAFYKHPDSNDGHTSRCKLCHRETTRMTHHKRRVSNPDKDRDRRVRYDLKKNFGITLEQYDDMLERQSGVCAVCGKPETKAGPYGIQRLCVDHDHHTGKIRALLCNRCNVILGLSDDNHELLLGLAAYLERYIELD